jgi:hypothetical protein
MAIGDSSHRYILADHESTSLYRTVARESGIPQRTAAQDNLHLWFNSDKPCPPDPRLSASCISYCPYIPGVTERLSIILTTPEQKLLAWKFGHKKQILMDLTFGVCSGRALLAILMALDDENKGLPVAFMMFTAKKQTKAVHADYDKALLEEQLKLWKEGMGKNDAGELFEVTVGSTDNDPRERHGLRANWSNILLLLCLFHVWQAWRNALNKYLRVIPKGPERQSTRQHIAKFLMRLLKEITDYDEAISEYNQKVLHFKTLAKARSPIAKDQSKGALAFLTYLQRYLNVRDFWKSWSLAGAEEAARQMGVPLSSIARTTNPLESFNGRLKGVYFAPYMHSGRLPRIDHWILTMINSTGNQVYYISSLLRPADSRSATLAHTQETNSLHESQFTHTHTYISHTGFVHRPSSLSFDYTFPSRGRTQSNLNHIHFDTDTTVLITTGAHREGGL